MKKSLMAIIIILVVVLIAIFIVNQGKKNGTTNNQGNTTATLNISALSELFPSSTGTVSYQEGDQKYNVKVTDVKTNDGITTVTTERQEKQGQDTVTVRMTYDISAETVIESGKYINNGQEVSTIYPVEVIKGQVQLGSQWQSVDGMITNKISKIEGNKVTIESSRSIDTYEEGKNTPVKKTFVETRVYEKGKGVIQHKTETK